MTTIIDMWLFLYWAYQMFRVNFLHDFMNIFLYLEPSVLESLEACNHISYSNSASSTLRGWGPPHYLPLLYQSLPRSWRRLQRKCLIFPRSIKTPESSKLWLRRPSKNKSCIHIWKIRTVTITKNHVSSNSTEIKFIEISTFEAQLMHI